MEELARPTGGADARLRPPTPRVALVAVAAAIVGLLLYLGRDALTPFVVGLLAVYLLDPPVERLTRVRLGRGRMPRWFAILVVYAVAIAVVIAGLNLTMAPLVRQLTDFVGNLPALATSLDTMLKRLAESYNGLQLPPQVRDLLDRTIADVQSGATGLDPGSVIFPVFRSVASFAAAAFGFFIVPFWAFYIIKDRPSMTAGVDAVIPAEWRPDVRAIGWIVDTVFGRWVRGQLLLGLTVGGATFIGLIALDLLVDPVFGRFAVLFAMIAGLLELLPIIGPIISAVPPILVALTVSPTAVVAAFLLYLGIQQVENAILVPKIQGDAIKLHPSVVVFTLIVGGAIAGLLGAILALPVTAAGRDIFRYSFRRLGPEPRPTAREAAAGVLGSSVERGSEPAGVDPPDRPDSQDERRSQAAPDPPGRPGRPGRASQAPPAGADAADG